jgi:uncharacterized protein YjbI with pentapeptide repeats
VSTEQINTIWRGLVVTIGLIAVGVVAWWFCNHVTAFGGWLDTYSETIRNLTLAAGVGAAVFGGWVAYRRSQTDRLRQVTDSFEGAVVLLGHEDRSVRLGAIYALERIARQNRDEHWPIMETLTAYVRDWSERRKQAVDLHLEIADLLGSPGEASTTRRKLAEYRPQPAPVDIEAAFTVLGRRRLDHERDPTSALPQCLKLTGAYLVGVSPDPGRRQFGVAVLTNANLAGAELTSADLKRARLKSANLVRAELTWADLSAANLMGANIRGADLAEADLTEANLHKANLVGANLREARLVEAKLTRASLVDAFLGGADLAHADLAGADLGGTHLFGADLSHARNLTQKQLNSANGDAQTKLPEGLTRPPDWVEVGQGRDPRGVPGGAGTMSMVSRFTIVCLIASMAGCSSSTARQQHRAWLAEEARREAQALDAAHAERTAGLRRVEAKIKRERQLGTDPQAWAAYADELEREGDDAGAAAAWRKAQYLASIADCDVVGDLRYDLREIQARTAGGGRMTEACIRYYNHISGMGAGAGDPISDLERRVRELEAQVY